MSLPVCHHSPISQHRTRENTGLAPWLDANDYSTESSLGIIAIAYGLPRYPPSPNGAALHGERGIIGGVWRREKRDFYEKPHVHLHGHRRRLRRALIFLRLPRVRRGQGESAREARRLRDYDQGREDAIHRHAPPTCAINAFARTCGASTRSCTPTATPTTWGAFGA